ncbi:MAG: hypothetical protein ACT4PM_15270 [Gemmatimonadales bacterium]
MGRLRWYYLRLTTKTRRRRLHAMLKVLDRLELRNAIDEAGVVETMLGTASIGFGETGRLSVFQYGAPAEQSMDLTLQMGASLILAEEGVSLGVCARDRLIFADLGRIGALLRDAPPNLAFGEWQVVRSVVGPTYAALRWDGRLQWVEGDGQAEQRGATWGEALPRLKSWSALVMGFYATGHAVAEVTSPLWLRQEGKLTTQVFRAK